MKSEAKPSTAKEPKQTNREKLDKHMVENVAAETKTHEVDIKIKSGNVLAGLEAEGMHLYCSCSGHKQYSVDAPAFNVGAEFGSETNQIGEQISLDDEAMEDILRADTMVYDELAEAEPRGFWLPHKLY